MYNVEVWDTDNQSWEVFAENESLADAQEKADFIRNDENVPVRIIQIVSILYAD